MAGPGSKIPGSDEGGRPDPGSAGTAGSDRAALPDGTGAGLVALRCSASKASGIGAGCLRENERRVERIGPKPDSSLGSGGTGGDSLLGCSEG